MKYLILLSIVFLVSCNPCKYVAKHPECFPADTVIINKETIKYKKIFIRNDSIILDTIPCDPITKTYYKTKTVYKTKTIETIDTIYQDRTTSKINPLNQVIKEQKEALEHKNKTKNKVIGGLILLIIVIVLLFKVLK